MVSPSTDHEQKRLSLANFLRRNRERVLSEWEGAVRAIPSAAALDSQALRDRIPVLLDRIAVAVEQDTAPLVDETPESHAVERIEAGFSLEELTHEYALLRRSLLELFQQEESLLEAGALLTLNRAIDEAVERAVAKYHNSDLRRLEALDRVGQAGEAPSSLNELLHQLLRIVIETTETIDTGVIYLREWDRLVVRAAVGLESGVDQPFSLALGEGFAGAIAVRKEPLFTPSAATDPLVRHEILRMKSIRALYGVPLMHGDEVIGVAKMGSRRAGSFLPEERHLLRSMAERAAGLIAQRRLTEERELLLSILGHDLRTPLTTILLGASSMLRHREGLPEPAAHNVERMANAARRMDRMIGDLTDLTKMRVGGALPLNLEDVDLSRLVQDLAAEARAAHPGRELRVEVSGHGEGTWDRNRVGRALTNLVNNAVAYGDESTPVTIGFDGRDEASVKLTVHNEGAAIPPELRPHMFEPYRRSGPSAGTGLGLYIVRQVARAHGGSVDVESSAEHGTTFCVRLPRASARREP